MAEEVWPTTGDRRIDHILLPPCVSEHIQTVFTTPVGRADHQAVVVTLAPTVDRKTSNLWKFPSYLLGESKSRGGMQEVFMTSQHLRGVQWWDWVLSQARHLAQHLDKQTRGRNRGVLTMQRALATSSPTCLSSAAEQILLESDVSYDTTEQDTGP